MDPSTQQTSNSKRNSGRFCLHCCLFDIFENNVYTLQWYFYTPLTPQHPSTCGTTPSQSARCSCNSICYTSAKMGCFVAIFRGLFVCLLRKNWVVKFVRSFDQLILRKIIEILATRCQILRLKWKNAPNSISAGVPPQTPLGSLQRSPRSPSWISGALLLRGGRGREDEERGGKGREGTGRGGKKRGKGREWKGRAREGEEGKEGEGKGPQ